METQTSEHDPLPAPALDPELARIVRRALPNARLVRAVALGPDDGARTRQVTAKAAGYGTPIRLEVEVEGKPKSFVLHGTSSNPFGHDRRADRAAELLLAADTFGAIPRHAQALDVGAFRRDGTSVSLQDSGEFYLLTEYVEGHPYADDLRAIARRRAATPADFERVRALADYLVQLHTPLPDGGVAHARSLRDLLGGGEGIFGIVDGYGLNAAGADAQRLQGIESRCLEWRWRLKRLEPRPTRIHGDFHPFNVLFDDAGSLHVLDTSRGSLGDAADDVTCMAANFIFFALEDKAAWHSALAPLWREFWTRYLAQAGDARLLSVAAPFLTWRLLVLACPVWYPNLSADARGRLLRLAEAALDAERFDPDLAEQVFR
ncbi:MAG TPA: aminoglycoside phosphotransferase family protein [Polyangiaceae bacterium]